MMDTDPILNLIDSALTDPISPDAMRHTPAGDTSVPRALRLGIDGAITPVDLPGGSQGNLDAYYAAIGCRFVDVVALAPDLDMWIDDEGIGTQEINFPATILARRYGLRHQDYWGPVVFTGSADDEGDTLPLSPERAQSLIDCFSDEGDE